MLYLDAPFRGNSTLSQRVSELHADRLGDRLLRRMALDGEVAPSSDALQGYWTWCRSIGAGCEHGDYRIVIIGNDRLTGSGGCRGSESCASCHEVRFYHAVPVCHDGLRGLTIERARMLTVFVLGHAGLLLGVLAVRQDACKGVGRLTRVMRKCLAGDFGRYHTGDKSCKKQLPADRHVGAMPVQDRGTVLSMSSMAEISCERVSLGLPPK
ncbi:hypothetical protein BDZ85DRAFT_264824 [Elsinoe ampelina]|uniref:Uncharacterized protein n=1 Tax=Elsinoe ampelina TaxID=302913 RepID=A0A6A6G8G2_9PEZI|nr:hypothetical protein BDZ85DRAFT_264824 [Elsinoe ampelina]